MTAPKELADGPIADLATMYVACRQAQNEADEVAREASQKREVAELALFDAMENAGLTSVRTKWGLFTLNDLAWASIEDEQAAREWAAQVSPDMLTLNRSRLSAVVRKQISGEQEVDGADPKTGLPPGVTYRTSRKINFRATK